MSGDTGGDRPAPGRGARRPRQLARARVGWPPALRELKNLLYEVYLAAEAPSLDEISGDIAADDDLPGAPSRDTIHRVLTDGERRGQQADVVAVAVALAHRAGWDAPDLAARVRELWVRAWMAQGAGRTINEFRGDPELVLDGGLGIHPALDTEGARDRFGFLPPYVPRDHDTALKSVVAAATEGRGRSGIAVLVGGSSTGKTRALWEAVRELPDDWRLWHPLTPTAPGAVLATLPDIAPKTVVWLNEAQNYLEPDPLGEQVAAGLRELLHNPLRAPILLLGTLWPERWDTLTTSSQHANARALLSSHNIDVPDAFTPADLAALDATDVADPRLKQAAQHARGAQITQYLAGVPYLMDRYQAARGVTLALIHAAMDARRLGAGPHIPLVWLDDAAPGYLDDDEAETLDRGWLAKALAYVAEPCNGIPGILTLVTANGPRNRRLRRRSIPSPLGPHYLLADYLDQHGRHNRAEIIPPIDFWIAANHAHPADLTTLGNAAWARGLYRDATQLHKSATTHGNPSAAAILVDHMHTLNPTDPRPAQWAATHTPLHDPGAVARLLRELRTVGAQEQATALLARNPAAHTALADPFDVAWLLEDLRKAGAHEQVTALAKRVVAHAALDDPSAVARLLQDLRTVGAQEQATALLARNPAAHTALADSFGAARLLRELWEAGAHEQCAALAKRAAAHAVDPPWAVSALLWELRRAGAHEQFAALAKHAAAHAALDDPSAVARLLRDLREAGAHEQVTALAKRAAAHAALDDPGAVVQLRRELRTAGAHEQATALLARNPAAHAALTVPFALSALLQDLREVGMHEQVTALAKRAAADAALDDPIAVALLLRELWEAGAHEQFAALAKRAAGHAALDDPGALFAASLLLRELRKAGVNEQFMVLAKRAAAHAALDDPSEAALLLRELREAGAREQCAALAKRAATHAALDDPSSVARLLRDLRKAGAHEQFTVLAKRAAAHAALDAPWAFADLLHELREAGAHEQFAALTKRAAAHAAHDAPRAVAELLRVLREAGAHEHATALTKRAAAHAALDEEYSVTELLRELREAGAHEHATALLERLPATGHFDLFVNLGGNPQRFGLGRDPDGGAAPPWTWNDLD